MEIPTIKTMNCQQQGLRGARRCHLGVCKEDGCLPGVENCEITSAGAHNFESTTLDHLGIIRVFWELFSPCQVVLWCPPLPIIDVGVTSRNLVDQDIPGELSSNTPDLPIGAFLQYHSRARQLCEELMMRGCRGAVAVPEILTKGA